MTNRGFAAVFILFAVLALGAGCGRKGSSGNLQDFRLEALDGSRFYLRDYRGKTVAMVFWSVHCVPCHRLLSVLSRHSLVKDESVKLVSVCVDPADRALVEQGAGMFGGQIPILLDHNRALGEKLGIKTEPITLIIDGKGAEISRIVGYDESTVPQITKAIAVSRQNLGP